MFSRQTLVMFMGSWVGIVMLSGCGQSTLPDRGDATSQSAVSPRPASHADPEPERWRLTEEADTFEAYEMFLKDFPAGTHGGEATARLADPRRVRDHQAWGRARRSDTAPDYVRYLSRNPEGHYRRQAAARLDDLAWASAEKERSLFAYLGYLENHPQGAHAAAAKQAGARITKLTNEEFEARLALLPAIRGAMKAQEQAADALLGRAPKPGASARAIAAQVQRDMKDIHAALAAAQAHDAEWARAADQFQRALAGSARKVERANQHSQAGTALLASGELAQAERAFRDALTEFEFHEGATYGLALALERMGRLEEALQYCEAAAQLMPERQDVREACDRVRQAVPGKSIPQDR